MPLLILIVIALQLLFVPVSMARDGGSSEERQAIIVGGDHNYPPMNFLMKMVSPLVTMLI